MSHEIEQFADGTSAFFSARVKPWHNLGTVTESTLTATEALTVASLAGWDVRKMPVYIDGGIPVPNKWATVRTNPNDQTIEPLGVVGSVYEPVQNEASFQFLDALIDASEGAHYETAGSLRGGTRVFMTVKLPRDMIVGAGEIDDRVETYLLCTNSHDGTSPFTVALTPVRVVCQNTLNMALGAATLKSGMRWTARHTSSATSRRDEAMTTLSLAWKIDDAFEAEANALYQTAITERKFDSIVSRLFPLAKDATDRQRNAVTRTRDEVRAIYTSAPTQKGLTGNGWGVVNAVAEWADFARPVRPGETTAAIARATQIIDGGAIPKLKARAVDLVLAK